MSLGGSPPPGSPTLPWLFETYGPAKMIRFETVQPFGRLFPPLPFHWISGDPINPDSTSVGIAHWCLTLGYVGIWCAGN